MVKTEEILLCDTAKWEDRYTDDFPGGEEDKEEETKVGEVSERVRGTDKGGKGDRVDLFIGFLYDSL